MNPPCANTDRDYIETSMERIVLTFKRAIVDSEITSYKLAPRHRHGEHGEPPPTREQPGLTGLADTLDELVPR